MFKNWIVKEKIGKYLILNCLGNMLGLREVYEFAG